MLYPIREQLYDNNVHQEVVTSSHHGIVVLQQCASRGSDIYSFPENWDKFFAKPLRFSDPLGATHANNSLVDSLFMNHIQ